MSLNYTYNYPEVARDSGFKLRNYKDGPLDWRLMGSLEVERILRDQSLEQIDSVLNHLSEAPLGSILESNILDSGIAKYFILSQFSIQYLVFCRTFLEETVTDLKESHGVSQMENSNLKRSLSEANNEILQLHKKITQMEAIHEVIYPCHLCTKNFVSNDALNLHISRKHSGLLPKPDKKCESPLATVKERENDLTLINTIKLELEIKQLKERLNNAEREIKQRSNLSASKDIRDCNKSEKLSVNSIGIQSNLAEIKEKDDNYEDDASNSSHKRVKLFMVQEKLQEFERWKEEQKNQNSEFLTEINNKLQDLNVALEMTKNQGEQMLNSEKLRASPSVEDLEVLLSKKVEDIGKASAAKLEEVVNKIEMNYRGKLEDLEREMKKNNEKSKIQKASKTNFTDGTQTNTITVAEKHKEIKQIDDTFEVVEIEENNTNINNSKEIFTNDTQTIDENEYLHQKDSLTLREKSSSQSNHTFVKAKIIQNFGNVSIGSTDADDQKKVSRSDENDCTDISESLQDEELEKIEIFNKTNNHIEEVARVKKLGKPKNVTRKQANKLTNSRLESLGVDMKTKSLTQASKKRISEELNKKRNELKQKHPQFYDTRNKIKKFVDKLCSSKMSKNAEVLLKATNPLKSNSKLIKSQDSEYSSSGEEENEAIKSSKPLNQAIAMHNTNFKQRLERILASPIRKPDEHRIKAVIHQHQPHIAQKPVPMPRKRVMFNQPDLQEKRLDLSLSNTESDEQISSGRYQKRDIKTTLQSSLGNLL